MIKIIITLKRKIHNLFHPQLGVILMLHRVIEGRSALKLNRDIEITPAFLEKTIIDYSEKGYKFVSLDEVEQILSGELKSKKPFVCFTFDDGYVDNFEIAYPIFKRHNCPFSIYITTDFVNHKAFIWWYILDDLLMNNDSLKLIDGSVFQTKTMDEKNLAFESMCLKLSELKPDDLKKTFEKWFSGYSFSSEQKVKDLSMSIAQLETLAKEPLCTIASHTVSHPRLENMTAAEQEPELLLSKQKLEQWTGKKIEHFAYPFGSHNENSVNLSAKIGYKTAVLAWGGNVRKGQNIRKLYRVFLKQF